MFMPFGGLMRALGYFNNLTNKEMKMSNNARPWTTDSDNTSGDDGNKFYLVDIDNSETMEFNNRKSVEEYIERHYNEDEADDLDVFYGLKRHISVTGGNFKVNVY